MKWRVLVIAVLAGGALLQAGASGAADAASAPAKAGFREIRWNELVPKGWDPGKAYRDKKLGALSDSSPQVLEAMREMRAAWDSAPTVTALDGATVKLPGYVVPLDEVNGELKEFLLVPYFGACIHTPPPPANQIVHVVASGPVKGFRAMDTVWVSGTLRAQRQDSYMGVSGYRMQAARVEAYVAPPR
jgi:hypothetical protein